MSDTYREPSKPRLAWQDRDQPKPRLRVVELETAAPEPMLFRPRSPMRDRIFPQAKPIATAIERASKYTLYPYMFGPKAVRDWMIPTKFRTIEDDAAAPFRHNRIVTIIATVADHYGVNPIDILSHRKTADIIRPRQVAMYLAKTLTLRSLPEIGRRMGGRDHTTILHGVRRITKLMEANSNLVADIAALTHRLTGGQS